MLRLQSVIMILSVLFKKKNKEKGIVRSQLSSFSTSLCLFSFYHTQFLPLFLVPPPLPTSFVQKCLLNKLTVL